MERINYHKGYLYCSVTLATDHLQDRYNTWRECYEDYVEDITDDCKKNGYDDDETNAVLTHYQFKLGNMNGEWKDRTTNS